MATERPLRRKVYAVAAMVSALPHRLLSGHNYPAQFLLWALLVLPACLALAYFPATKYNPYDAFTGGADGDAAQYIAIYHGASLHGIPKPYRYRFVVPVLARAVPLPPGVLLRHFQMSAIKVVTYRFAIVNALGLFLATVGLALLMGRLRFSAAEQLLGSFVFLTCFVTVNYGTVPQVDGASFAALALGIAAGAWRRWIALAAITLVAMFVKETSVLIAVGAILYQSNWVDRRSALLACLPGLVAYGVVRLFILPTTAGYSYSLSSAAADIIHYSTSGSGLVQFAYSLLAGFGPLLVLAPLGWVVVRRAGDRQELLRLTWLVLVVVALSFLLTTSLERVWFLAFPAMIPLSVVAVSYVATKLDSKVGSTEARRA